MSDKRLEYWYKSIDTHMGAFATVTGFEFVLLGFILTALRDALYPTVKVVLAAIVTILFFQLRFWLYIHRNNRGAMYEKAIEAERYNSLLRLDKELHEKFFNDHIAPHAIKAFEFQADNNALEDWLEVCVFLSTTLIFGLVLTSIFV